MGLPCTDLYRGLEGLRYGTTGYSVINEKAWVLRLSPNERYEFYEQPEEQINVLYKSMGKDSSRGDIVFLVDSHHLKQDEVAKILAVYRVSSNPVSHPLFGLQSSLELISSFARPVNVSLQNQQVLKRNLLRRKASKG